MRLRKLNEKDAVFMLEWMHDGDVVEFLNGNFISKTLDDCKNFIYLSQKDDKNSHFAVVSDSDEYMGTVSLKNIDKKLKRAEFAIVVRKCAMGQGYSWFAMKEIFNYAFSELHLDSVYWCVSTDNVRACRFYEKHFFKRKFDIDKTIGDSYKNFDRLKWYEVSRKDFLI